MSEYDELPSVDQLNDSGELQLVYVAKGFVIATCSDPECSSVHVCFKQDGPLNVAATFSVPQCEEILEAAKLIRARKMC